MTIPTPALFPGKPEGFVSDSKYCRDEVWLGTLKAPDGSGLNWQLRNRFYPKVGKGHIARTPFYAIRYAISRWTEPGDLVLDPFMGSGTTGVEAILQGRRTTGIELEFPEIARATLSHFDPSGESWSLISGDSEICLDQVPGDSVSLVNFSNPYQGRSESSCEKQSEFPPDTPEEKIRMKYQHTSSTQFVRGSEYWRKMAAIQRKSCEKLKPGGHAVFVIKDLIKKFKVVSLHEQLADLLPDSMEHIGTFALPHYPPTLAMNSYIAMHKVRPPMEQICPVFRKKT